MFAVVATTVVGFNTVWLTVTGFVSTLVLVSWWATTTFCVTTVGTSRVEMTVRGAADTVTTSLLVTGTVTECVPVMEVVCVTRWTTGTSLRTRCPFSRTVDTWVTLTGLSLTTVTELTLPLIVWTLSNVDTSTWEAYADERPPAAR